MPFPIAKTIIVIIRCFLIARVYVLALWPQFVIFLVWHGMVYGMASSMVYGMLYDMVYDMAP